MNQQTLWLLFACVVVSFAQLPRKGNSCIKRQTCGECIAAASSCAWCKAENFDLDENRPRCDLIENLYNDQICDPSQIVNPDHELTFDKKSPVGGGSARTDAVQLSPQEITFKLRPNKPVKFNVTFRLAENYPVDLYYLMDLSNSMKDDKEKLATLGSRIAKNMSDITKNFRLGFGSFVDKVVLPYVSTIPAKLVSPCEGCVKAYGFRHVLALDQDASKFTTQVREANVSGNLDAPEGGFDAIMQAIACNQRIGWREVSRKLLIFSTDAGFHYAGDGKTSIGWRNVSRKIMVYSSDADFHYAGDGKLAGIVKPNDGHCHLDNKGYYSESSNQDYPSISQIAAKIKEKKINMIFAVTEDQMPTYEKLKKYIEGSIAGKLANDSSNIVNLIRKNYETISSRVTLNTLNAENVTVNFKSKCLGNVWNETNECDGLQIGKQVTFDISIEVTDCPTDEASRKRNFTIYPVGLGEKLVINLDLLCECECEKNGTRIENSSICSGGNGTYECGQCTCHEGRYGKNCECGGSDVTSEESDEKCKMPNSTSTVPCLGRGDCVCGRCECHPLRQDSAQKYRGLYCECDDTSCDHFEGEVCGGPRRGKCDCGTCLCHTGYTGPSCGCATGNQTCMASNGKICNDQGDCVCGKCVCKKDSFFRGPKCEDCDQKGCKGKCDDSKECVQCTIFKSGPKSPEECKRDCRNIVEKDKVEVADGVWMCQFRDDDDCIFYFTYEYDPLNNNVVHIKAQRTKVCPEPVNILAIVLGVIGGIVAVGLCLLLIWKLLTTIHDRREFAKFEKERQNAKWDAGENPIYKPSTSTYKNPTFAGKQ